MARPHDTESDGFETLLRPHIEYLFRVAYRFTGVVEEAEDLVQDVLVKLYPRAEELRGLDRPRPWLVRVLYREYVDRVRRRARSRLVELRRSEDEGADDPLDTFAADDPATEELIDRDITAERLSEALRTLETDHRALVMLHDVEGYTLEELQGILELPLGTLKSRLHRARARLRRQLGGNLRPSEDV